MRQESSDGVENIQDNESLDEFPSHMTIEDRVVSHQTGKINKNPRISNPHYFNLNHEEVFKSDRAEQKRAYSTFPNAPNETR